MKKQRTKITGLPRVVISGLMFALLGTLLAEGCDPIPDHGAWSKTILPDAYRVPKLPGGTALRLAMVHDILHERYLHHGPAWYRKRNEDAAAILAGKPASPIDEKYLDAMDARLAEDREL